MKKKLLVLSLFALMTSVFSYEKPATEVNASEVNGTSDEYNYYYNDSYFLNDARTYNEHLATMSFVLSTRCGSKDRSSSMFESLGFGEIDTNGEYDIKDNMDTNGVCIANKTINDGNTTLIGIGINATAISEWGGDATIGSSGYHKNFGDCAERLISFLNEYEKKYGDDFKNDVKVWITGYSRGASVANIAAKILDDNGCINEHSVGMDDIFAYTFESTKTVELSDTDKDPASYTNIFNIYNKNDIVNYSVPESMGFVRYGVDIDIWAGCSSTQYDRMLNTISNLKSEYARKQIITDDEGNAIHILDTIKTKKVKIDKTSLVRLGRVITNDDGEYEYKFYNEDYSLAGLLEDDNRLVSELFDSLADHLSLAFNNDRNIYVHTVEPLLRVFLLEFIDLGAASSSVANMYRYVSNQISENKDALLAALMSYEFQALNDMLISYFKDGAALYQFDLETYQNLILSIDDMATVLPFVLARFVAVGGMDDLASLIYNLDKIKYGHTYEMCYGWLTSYDSNYFDDAESVNKCQKTFYGYQKEGLYNLSVNGYSHELYVREVDDDEFTFYDASKDSYVSVDEGKITYSNEAAVFTYSNGAFSIKSRVYGTGTVSKYIKLTKKFYLTSDGSLTLSTDSMSATLSTKYSSLNHDYEYYNVDSNSHYKICQVCGDTTIETHRYQNGKCICGRYEDSYANDIEVEATIVSEKQTKKVLFIKKSYYVYTLNIGVKAKVPASDFKYTINDESKTYDSLILVTENKITKVTVYLTNANGDEVVKVINF